MAGFTLVTPPSLRDFLGDGGNVIGRLGVDEAAVLCASFDTPSALRAGMAAALRRIVAGYLDGSGAEALWPVDQRLVDRVAWSADLLEDDRLAMATEKLLRSRLGLPWRLWPESWTVVSGQGGADVGDLSAAT
jgi:hypothetical protein